MSRTRALTESEFISEAQSPLRRIFSSDDPFGEPLSETMAGSSGINNPIGQFISDITGGAAPNAEGIRSGRVSVK